MYFFFFGGGGGRGGGGIRFCELHFLPRFWREKKGESLSRIQALKQSGLKVWT